MFVLGAKVSFAEESVNITITVSCEPGQVLVGESCQYGYVTPTPSVYNTTPGSNIELSYDTNLKYCGYKVSDQNNRVDWEDIDGGSYLEYTGQQLNEIQGTWYTDVTPFSYIASSQEGSYSFDVYCFDPDANVLLDSNFTVNVSNPGINLTGTSWQNWIGGGREAVWVNENVSNNMIVYPNANYKLSWDSTSMSSCKLDNVAVATSGSKNDLTASVSSWSKTHIFECTSLSGATVSKNLIVSVPPKPTGGSGSCDASGTSGSFSWTAPAGYNTFYTRIADETGSLVTSDGWNDNFVGTTKTFTATPGKTYSWWVQSKSANTAWSEEVSGVINCPIPQAVSYTITSSSSSGGSISPSGSSAVTSGESKTFSYSPSNGYFLSSLTVDGLSKSTTEYFSSYTFSNVSSDHSIGVSFSQTIVEECSNGATNYPQCTLICTEECPNGAKDFPTCNLCVGGAIVDINTPCPPVKQCLDGLDNDKDGKLDLLDPDCVGPNDDTEGKGFIYKEN